MSTNPPRNGNRPARPVKAPPIPQPDESAGDSSPDGDDLSVMTAFEDLLCRVVDLEALAHAAEQASQGLPSTREPELRRVIRHVQALICLIADITERTLAEAEEQRNALSTGAAS